MSYKTLPFVFLSLISFRTIGQDAEAIKYHVSYSIKGNNLTEVTDVVLQINNRNGDRYGKIIIPFTKGDKISSIEAAIFDARGNLVRKLKGSEISTVSAVSSTSLYEDDYVKRFELMHNAYPYRVYYRYTITYGKFLEIANWAPFITPEMPCKEATLQVTVPVDYPIRYYHKDVDFKTEQLTKTTKYSWTGSFPGTQLKEAYAPPLNEVVPFVKITPMEIRYGVSGSFNNWIEFGNWVYRLNQGLNNLPDSEKAKIDNMIKGVNDPKEISRILYRYLQDVTRYINVKLDIGGLKPYPAEYVARNKYGDCKALTNYMKSMLEYAGIPSYYSLVYASNNPVKPNPDFPGQYFNHAILMVPFKQDTVWLECTDNICPYGYLGTFTQGRDALVIAKDNSRFIKTPALCEQKSLISVNSHFELDGTGKSIVEMNIILRGQAFDYLNSTLLSEKEKERFVHEFVPFTGFELLDWRLKKENRESDEIRLYMKIHPANFPRKYGNDLILHGFNVGLPDFDQPEKRNLPVRINYPLHRADTTVYTIPQGFNISHSLEGNNFDSKYGSYKFQLLQNGNELTMIKNLVLYRNEIALSDYPKFFDFLDSIKNQERKNAIIINK
jgi:transglutaminase-like putative cysteine protease